MDIIDNFIHQERLNEKGIQKTFLAAISTLPDGTFITLIDSVKAYLWYRYELYEWSFSGYSKVLEFAQNQEVNVLTPFSYVETFRVWYLPQIHFSAE